MNRAYVYRLYKYSQLGFGFRIYDPGFNKLLKKCYSYDNLHMPYENDLFSLIRLLEITRSEGAIERDIYSSEYDFQASHNVGFGPKHNLVKSDHINSLTREIVNKVDEYRRYKDFPQYYPFNGNIPDNYDRIETAMGFKKYTHYKSAYIYHYYTNTDTLGYYYSCSLKTILEIPDEDMDNFENCFGGVSFDKCASTIQVTYPLNRTFRKVDISPEKWYSNMHKY